MAFKTKNFSQYKVIKAIGQTADETIQIPAGYYILNVIIKNQGGGGAVTGNLKCGTSAGGSDVFSIAVGAGPSSVPIKQSDLISFEFGFLYTNQTLYISAGTSWNGAILDIFIILVQYK